MCVCVCVCVCVSECVCVCVCVISVSRLTSESVDTSRCDTWLSVQVGKTDTVSMLRKECSARCVSCFRRLHRVVYGVFRVFCSVWSVLCSGGSVS